MLEQYHNILVRHAVPSGLRLLGQGFVFQQDNDPRQLNRMTSILLRICGTSGSQGSQEEHKRFSSVRKKARTTDYRVKLVKKILDMLE